MRTQGLKDAMDKPLPKPTLIRDLARPRRRGFTAIELTAVATIITILALILLPIVRKRVDQSRLVAAEDDMRTIEIAQTLARADTGHFFRISDLELPGVDDEDLADAIETGDPNQLNGMIRQLPRSYWNRAIPNFQLTATETSFDIIGQPIVTMWDGPYTRFSSTKFGLLGDLVRARPTMFRSINISTSPPTDLVHGGTTPDADGNQVPHGDGGPILIIRNTDLTARDFQDDVETGVRTAIDPWGAPYVFFGPERIRSNLPTDIEGNESNFGIASVYSLGPDGMPGDGSEGDTETLYYREAPLIPLLGFENSQGVIGRGDDLVRTF